ncbi:hypothetical protein OXX59_009561, partial [Metschnikowia pulcherrima]
RSLFNKSASEKPAGFSLAVEEDDIDEEKEKEEERERQKLLEQIKLKQEQEREQQEQKQAAKRKFGLFWSHLDSPFLQTQTQLSKIGSVGQKFKLPGEKEEDSASHDSTAEGAKDDYEEWFWSVRGEISRECRRKRKEATRHMKKKNLKAYL